MQRIFDFSVAVTAFFIAIEPLIYYVYRKRHPYGGRMQSLHVRLLGALLAAAAMSANGHAPPTSALPVLDGIGIPTVIAGVAYLLGRSVRWGLHQALARHPGLLAASVAPVARRGVKTVASS